MAAVQFERDLRSAQRDIKRSKDATAKWSYGTRELAGCTENELTGEFRGSAESQRGKVRPENKNSDRLHGVPAYKVRHNIVKHNRANWELASHRVRVCSSAHEEIQDVSRSIVDLLGSPTRRGSSGYNNSPKGVSTTTAAAAAAAYGDTGRCLYSFDHADTPPHVLTLDVFVKPNVRATEKLVEKEYEVLDDNGDAVKGRKARQVLRKAAGGQPAAIVVNDDDDDFELV